MLQLQHAGDVPALRTTRTPAALQAASDAGLLDPGDAALLGLPQRPGAIRAARGMLHLLTWALSSTSPAERAARMRLGI